MERVRVDESSMMKLVIFVALFAVHYAHGLTEAEFKTPLGSALYLNTVELLSKENTECQLETAAGEVYKFVPGGKVIPDANDDRIWSLDRSTCSVGVLPIKKNDAGTWRTTVITNGKTVDEYKYDVYIRRNAGIIPAESVTVQEGYFIHGTMSAPSSALNNLKSCTVTNPQKQTFDVHNDVVDGIESFGKCGARILGKHSHNGLWTFEAVTNDFLVFTANLRVQVRARASEIPATNTITLTRGLPGKIVVGPSDAKFCRLRKSTYISLPLIDGPCRYDIPVVTSHYEGIWFMYYAKPGRIQTVVESFHINVTDQESIHSNVTYLENGDVEVSCTAHYAYPRSLSYCRFTTPSGKLLHAEHGISSDKYSTAEIPSSDDKEKDMYCGLIIHTPGADDYGMWKCEISSGTMKKEIIGTLVDVQKNGTIKETFNNRKVDIEATKVYAKRGDSYTMKCVTNEILDYCWFRSPNGTTFSVSASKQEKLPTNNTLAYNGAGLALGECAAEIGQAKFTDDGEWSCHLGIANGKEQLKSFLVTISENDLIARSKSVPAYGGVSLSCGVLPEKADRAVHYCRWIRPDGYGIYNGAHHRYSTTTSKTECGLRVLDFQPEEDAGQWRCVAGVMGSQLEEQQAMIFVDYKTLEFMSPLVLGFTIAGSAIVAMAVVAFIIVQVCKRRQRKPQQPPQPSPAYEEAAHSSPKSLNPNYDSKEFQY